ncbi:hypothetical protein [Amycolatopsis sp. WQ 127309]|uniref:hypothetical protein n=1 Tax=Amycolatopsis sp. WQ 127309 TaxID=2932773 RepID=UPI001FF122FF|nr:hypothetical protein [Amycolatopsis sp. WQ 127309]UOZ06893.1 hypothetical protein MUY22_00950 [Amycolatopsis sp. WQ 127309]
MQNIFSDAVDGLAEVPDESVDCVLARPDVRLVPADAAVIGLRGVWSEVRRVLRPTGTSWLTLCDHRVDGSQVGLPWRVAFTLQRAGWLLRNAIVDGAGESWSPPRMTFLLVRQPQYYFELRVPRSSGPHRGDVVLSGEQSVDERFAAVGCPADGITLSLFGGERVQADA